ncbi:hypothetical protein [Arthrobacter sp. NicSoilB8]|uniref:hypothetical protein n=1 Tax=Arthrobacter sp. NicSoilB8 TaxID=2830998 RepID=UPI001CC4CF00|nr:hypothetical protein [Arthrobacter sp. NicSoilB8]BCW72429.1 hypothetical protein NicSoilB8_34730 [Arthrobacter sp. NicSoilB8]
MATTQAATPWAVLLCKFADNNDEPFPLIYYRNLFTSAGVGLSNVVDFFRVYSHGNIDIGGSQIFGWFTLPETKAEAYAKGRGQIVDDARLAAAANGVDLSAFWGVLVCTNVPFETFGVQNGRAAVADSLGTAPRILAQEVGHGYGLDHSMADGVAAEYQDRWDVMSALNAAWAGNPTFAQVGPGLNAANMAARGWLDPERVWVRTGWFDEQVTLRPHHRRDLPGFLVARVGPYYVELRINEDWDAGIGSPVVLVHRLDANRSWLMASASGQRFFPPGAVFERTDELANGMPKAHAEVVNIDRASRQATLRLSYQPTIRPLHAFVLPYPVKLGQPTKVVVKATDGLTSAPVQGEVRLHSYDVNGQAVDVTPFPTDTPTIVTLRAKRIFDPETKKWTDFEDPTGEVTAVGYSDTVLDLGY